MEIKQMEAAVEAVLFASGEPMPAEKLAQVIGTDKATLHKVVANMSDKREEMPFGVRIIIADDSYQMVTKPEFSTMIRSALDMRRNMPLSPAAMETLAIIAYNQPVTKGYIEQVRGVDSGGIVSSLEGKRLVEERGRLDVPGRPILYGTTLDFLRCFGLKTLNDLPKVNPIVDADGGDAGEAETTLKSSVVKKS
jgi:segregation and condensation protein B